jgi:hypothetical protein
VNHPLARVKALATVLVLGLLAMANVVVHPVPAVALAPVVAPSIALGRHHGCMLLPDGTVRCWGANSANAAGELGNDHEYWASLAPGEATVRVTNLTGATAIAAGGSQTCVIVADSSVQCWGANDFGQVGDGTTTNRSTPAAVAGLTGATSVAVGFRHACAVVSNGAVKCWGRGALGDGTANDSKVPVAAAGISGVTSLTAGPDGTCVVVGGLVKCWGQVAGGGAVLVPTVVRGLSDVKQIGLGSDFACVLTNAGKVSCWGGNGYGQLGDGSLSSSAVPVPVAGPEDVLSLAADWLHACALSKSGAVRCWGYLPGVPAHSGDKPVEVSRVAGATAVAVGGDRSCFLIGVGQVLCDGVPASGSGIEGEPVGGLPYSGFLAVSPARLVDSRPVPGTVDGLDVSFGKIGPAAVREVMVLGRGGVDFTATDVSLNVTVVDPVGPGFLTIWACTRRDGQGVARPNVSNLNFRAGQTIANSAIVGTGATGKVCVYADTSAHLIVDVTGFFVQSVTLDGGARRLFDTRDPAAPDDPRPFITDRGKPRAAGSTTQVSTGYRGQDRSGWNLLLVLNVTVVDAVAAGFATVWRCSEPRPTASSLNFGAGATIAAMVVTTASGLTGDICLYTSAATHLVVDLQVNISNGPPWENRMHRALVPARLLDSRPGSATIDGVQAGAGGITAGSVTRVHVAGRGSVEASATSVALSVAAVSAAAAGFLTVWPCGSPRPNASNVNFASGQTVANVAMVGLDATGEVCVFTSAATDLIVDATGFESL